MRGQSAEIRFFTLGAPEDGGKTCDTQPAELEWTSISVHQMDTSRMPFREAFRPKTTKGGQNQSRLTQEVVVDTYLLLGCRDFDAI